MGYRTYTCPIARACGGCEWLAVPYPIQLKRKQEAVEMLLGEMAQADNAQVEPICGMDAEGMEPRVFRHKAATPFAPGSRGRIRCGFYSPGTHHIVPCASCLVEDSRCRPILNGVARVGERLGIRAYHEDKGTGSLRHAIVRTALYGSEALLTIVTNGDELHRASEFVAAMREIDGELSSIVQNINTRKTNAMLGSKQKLLYGPGVMHDTLLGCTFEIGSTTFYQTNPLQTEVLYALALEMAQLQAGTRLLDAYCGTGTIGICAAKQCSGIELVGVERITHAVLSARTNARINGCAAQSRFVCDDAERFLLREAKAGTHYDVVLLDPPRAGSSEAFLTSVCAVAPERVVYISCNPKTLARDVAFMRQRGWKLRRVAPVDLFGHTKHVECVALMVRR